MRRRGGHDLDARQRCPCLAGADPVWRSAPERRAAGRRHCRMAAVKTIGILSRDVRDHSRREVRRLSGVDAARHFVCLRHLSRRRPGPRQGGDLVLSGRQSGDRAARHRAVVRLRADAVAGGGRDCRDLRLAAQRHRQNHVRRREGDRNCQLRPDRGFRRPAGLDQGRRIHPRAAGAAAGACDGARGGCAPRSCRSWTRSS